jgi:hypothetical protein
MIGMACLLFLDLGSGAVLRWWAVGMLVLVWVALFVLSLAWWSPHPRRLPWVAGAGFGIWLVLVVGVSLATR